MERLDFKKEYRDLYLPKKAPSKIHVPPILFLAVDGCGAPEGESYQQSVQMLYTLSFTIKMSKMSDNAPEGYFEYVVPPLEGLWENENADRCQWRWTSMIRQPDFVTGAVLEWARETAARKRGPLPFGRVRLVTLNEGECVQAMHVGPYSEESAALARIQAYLEQNGLASRIGEHGARHHEIYLGDPRRVAPDRLRTVLRIPVRPNA